jgi:mRNA-degrading endonuclease RelE of RelBE toxin-antitoxin system
MTVSQPYKIIYAVQVKAHLNAIERRHHTLIRYTIEDQLQFEPTVETRNRKPLTRLVEFEADWEIRFGPNNRFRVFYEVNEADREVYIIAIGVKQRNKVLIAGEEIDL